MSCPPHLSALMSSMKLPVLKKDRAQNESIATKLSVFSLSICMLQNTEWVLLKLTLTQTQKEQRYNIGKMGIWVLLVTG